MDIRQKETIRRQSVCGRVVTVSGVRVHLTPAEIRSIKTQARRDKDFPCPAVFMLPRATDRFGERYRDLVFAWANMLYGLPVPELPQYDLETLAILEAGQNAYLHEWRLSGGKLDVRRTTDYFKAINGRYEKAVR